MQIPPHIRFWKFVNKTDTCWLWIGHTDQHGYGRFRLSTPRTKVIAHRFAWFLTYGPIPEGLHCCHHCDTPACVRPDHLFLGNDHDNHMDAVKKGRLMHGEKHYLAKLTDKDVRKIIRLKGTMTQKDIAKQFQVCRESVAQIHQGKTWKHIPR